MYDEPLLDCYGASARQDLNDMYCTNVLNVKCIDGQKSLAFVLPLDSRDTFVALHVVVIR